MAEAAVSGALTVEALRSGALAGLRQDAAGELLDELLTLESEGWPALALQ